MNYLSDISFDQQLSCLRFPKKRNYLPLCYSPQRLRILEQQSWNKYFWQTFQNSSSFCFSLFLLVFCWSFTEHSQTVGQQGKERLILTPPNHFHQLQKHLHISRTMTAESSPLHILSDQTRNGNPWFPSASRFLHLLIFKRLWQHFCLRRHTKHLN